MHAETRRLASKTIMFSEHEGFKVVVKFNVKFNHKRFAKRFKMFLKLNYLLSINFEFEIK
jgi:hypothetical protein